MAATTNKGKKQEVALKMRIKDLRQANKSLSKSNSRLSKKAARVDKKSKELKNVRLELNRARAGRTAWRTKYYDLKDSLRPKRVKSHPYSLNLMLLGVVLHVTYGISLRGTAKALYSVGLTYGEDIKKISATSIRNWSLRLSLYYLSRQVEPGRYALIADESVSMGQARLLVLLLVRLEDGQTNQIVPLVMSDARVLHVESKSSWKGSDIAKVIGDKLKEHPGLEIAYSISDRGGNLKNAFNIRGIKWIGDCTHVISNCTQSLFQKDEQLNKLIKAMNGTRAKWALSKMAVYLAPALRNKARFHQLFTIYKWAQPIIDRWEILPEKARDELAYLQENRELIQTLRQIHSLIEAFSNLVKAKGINACTARQWREQYDHRCRTWTDNCEKIDKRVVAYHQEIMQYIERTRATLPDEDQILCCSDIIESIFGKYKNKGRFPMITEDALKIAAYPHDIQDSDVLAAMDSIPTQKISEWKRDNTTISLLAQKLIFKRKLVA
jgi:transposase-like protein